MKKFSRKVGVRSAVTPRCTQLIQDARSVFGILKASNCNGSLLVIDVLRLAMRNERMFLISLR